MNDDVMRDAAGNPVTRPKGPPPRGDKPADPVSLAAAHVFAATYAATIGTARPTEAPAVAREAANAYVEWFKSGGAR
jgi:pyruvate/2-oxoacid:ferredoxin oxidoreductase beta subunit